MIFYSRLQPHCGKGWKIKMKYLFIQMQSEFLRREHLEFDSAPETRASYSTKGWYQISHAIKDGGFLKISAERDGIRIEACFNIEENIPHGDNGSYEITRGIFAGTGTFLNVSRKENSDFNHFFVCHSSSSTKPSMLRWQVGVDSFIHAQDIETVQSLENGSDVHLTIS
jgi:hypothetical protein